MRYIIRAIKYFFYFAIIFAAIVGILMFSGIVQGDIDNIFRGGWDAIWKIMGIFVIIAAIYPQVAFINRRIDIEDTSFMESKLQAFLENRGYILVKKDEQGRLIFRAAKFGKKFQRMMEDQLTVTLLEDGLIMEGMRKDVMKLTSGFEYSMMHHDEE